MGDKMDWRPNNPYGTKVYGAFIDKKEKEYKAFEAGADAMLDALRAVHSLEGFERMTEVILKPWQITKSIEKNLCRIGGSSFCIIGIGLNTFL